MDDPCFEVKEEQREVKEGMECGSCIPGDMRMVGIWMR